MEKPQYIRQAKARLLMNKFLTIQLLPTCVYVPPSAAV